MSEQVKRYRLSYRHGVVSAENDAKFSPDSSKPMVLATDYDALQAAFQAATAERDALKRELFVVAEAIWRNVHREEMKHWAQGIRVSVLGVDSVKIEDTEFTALQSQLDRETLRLASLIQQRDGLSAVLAEAVTKRIFDMGREYGSDCHRIEFKVTYQGQEVGSGGLAVAPFRRYVREAIDAALTPAQEAQT